jgi:hypothetical protein
MATTSSTVQSRKRQPKLDSILACSHQGGKRVDGRSRTVLDESGSLAITAWTCAACGGLFEEIHILSDDGKTDRRGIRYAVRPQQGLDHLSGAVL